MDAATFFVILASALAYALLNCFLKSRADPLTGALAMAICGGVAALPVLYFTGLPEREALPFILVSDMIGLFYWLYLGKAYTSDDVGVIFPLAHGISPILTLFATSVIINEVPDPNQLFLILTIVTGIFIVLLSGADFAALRDHQTLLNAGVIAVATSAFTIVDGIGVRHASSAASYGALLFVLDGAGMLIFGCLFQRARLGDALNGQRAVSLVSGVVSVSVYCAALWAMTRAPIALVAALRESSVLFAAVMAVLWLKEPLRPGRILGAGIVALGLAFIRLV